MAKRKPLTIRQVRMLLKRQRGVCAVTGCGTVLVLGPKGQHTNFIDEHVQALGRGGSNALKNRALYCVPHAKAKTFRPRGGATTLGSDLYEINKTARIRDKRMGRREPKRPLKQGRPFPKQSRPLASRAWPKGRRKWQRAVSPKSN